MKPNYNNLALQERNRQRNIAKAYLNSAPTPSNIYNMIQSFWNSLPFVGVSGADMNPYMLTGVAPTPGKIKNPNILRKLPIRKTSYYRQVDGNALDSYRSTGVVSQYGPSGGQMSRYDVPMFSKGAPSPYRIENPKYGDAWLVSKPKSKLEWETVEGRVATPKVGGQYNKAPISEFDFYRYDPKRGFVRLGGDLHPIEGPIFSNQPHIDYLNGLDRSLQIQYLTQNGLNDLWLWTLKNNPSHLESALLNAIIP